MENPTDKIIRQLKDENSRLLALLSGAGIAAPMGSGGGGEGADGAGGADVEAMRAKLMEENEAKLKEQMAENEKIINEMKKTWGEKLKDSAAIVTNSMGDSGAVHARNAMETKIPYLMNLHEDPQLSECVLYVFKQGTTRIGRKNPDVPQDVCLSGLNILAEHALVTNSEGVITIEALNKSKTFVNGDICSKVTELHTGDRVILGNNFVFRFTNPEEPDERDKKPDKDREWSEAIDEFSTKQGLRLQQSLGGEMGKLEQEETQKRKELEERVRFHTHTHAHKQQATHGPVLWGEEERKREWREAGVTRDPGLSWRLLQVCESASNIRHSFAVVVVLIVLM